MIHSVTVKNYAGDELELELSRPEKSGLIVREISGLGPVAEINTSKAASSDGEYFNSAKLNKRNIVLDLLFHDVNMTIEEIRLLTYKMFPVKREVTLTFLTDNRKAYIKGYVESNQPNIFSDKEGSQISILCPDPFFYSFTSNVTEVKGVIPLFEFPFSIEYELDEEKVFNRLGYKRLAIDLLGMNAVADTLEFGTVNSEFAGLVYYRGDEETGVEIELNFSAPVTELTVYNTTTKEQIEFNMTKLKTIIQGGIKAGDIIIINTRKGSKSIQLLRSGVSYNILNAVNRLNFSWIHVIIGYNTFAFKTISKEESETVRCYVNNQIVYEGI